MVWLAGWLIQGVFVALAALPALIIRINSVGDWLVAVLDRSETTYCLLIGLGFSTTSANETQYVGWWLRAGRY